MDKWGYDEVNREGRRAYLGNHDLTAELINTSILSKTSHFTSKDSLGKGGRRGGEEGEKRLPEVW